MGNDQSASPAYMHDDPIKPIQLDDLLTQNVKSRQGLSYKQVILPIGTVFYRGIRSKNCEKLAVERGEHGRWYGSIKTAKSYSARADNNSGRICAVELTKPIKLLDMTDPGTQALLLERFANINQRAQYLVSQAFAIRMSSHQTQKKYRKSEYEADEIIVDFLCSAFPKVDGYIWLSKWHESSDESFHNEIYLCNPSNCVSLLSFKKINEMLYSILNNMYAEESQFLLDYLIKFDLTIEEINKIILQWSQQNLKNLNVQNIANLYNLFPKMDVGFSLNDSLQPIQVIPKLNLEAVSTIIKLTMYTSMYLDKLNIDSDIFIQAFNNLSQGRSLFNVNFTHDILQIPGLFDYLLATTRPIVLFADFNEEINPQLAYITNLNEQNWADLIFFTVLSKYNNKYIQEFIRFPSIMDELSWKKFLNHQESLILQYRPASLTMSKFLELEENFVRYKLSDIENKYLDYLLPKKQLQKKSQIPKNKKITYVGKGFTGLPATKDSKPNFIVPRRRN